MSTVSFKISKAAPAAQLSTNAYAVVAGSEMSMLDGICLTYTILIATQSVKWKVFGANLATFADEVEVQGEATVVAAASSSYAVTVAPYAYYRVKIVDAVGGTHGTATVTGIAKR
jgi:hypothetical protein